MTGGHPCVVLGETFSPSTYPCSFCRGRAPSRSGLLSVGFPAVSLNARVVSRMVIGGREGKGHRVCCSHPRLIVSCCER